MNPQPAGFELADAAARWTKGLLVATLVLSLMGIVSGLLQTDLLSRAATGRITEAEVAENDSREQLIGLLQVPVFLGTGVAFLIWIYRAHRNLTALGGRELKYTPGWAVGSFLVPFVNLVRPMQVMREVWHGSDPSGIERDLSPAGPSIRRHLGTPPLVVWWWTLFLLSSFVGNSIVRMTFAQDQTLDQLQTFTSLRVLSDLIDIPSAVVAVLLVGQITRWQSDRRIAILRPLGETPGAAHAEPIQPGQDS